jgi:hypothetical protein
MFGLTTLSADAIEQLLPGATVRSLNPVVGGYEVALDLQRDDHARAMEDIESVLGQLGFAATQAAITEFVSSWLKGAAIAGAGGAAIGAASNHAETCAFLFLSGLVLGAVVGSTRLAVRARYAATRLYPANWHIVKLDQPIAVSSLNTA